MELGLAPLISRGGLGGVGLGWVYGLSRTSGSLLMAGAVSQCSYILGWLAWASSTGAHRHLGVTRSRWFHLDTMDKYFLGGGVGWGWEGNSLHVQILDFVLPPWILWPTLGLGAKTLQVLQHGKKRKKKKSKNNQTKELWNENKLKNKTGKESKLKKVNIKKTHKNDFKKIKTK